MSAKALRTVDHFLLCRFFDYQQVTFHKTVAGFELVLKDVIRALLTEGLLKCSAIDVEAMITGTNWASFGDLYLTDKMRVLLGKTETPAMKTKTFGILNRRPPKMVAQVEYIDDRSHKNDFRTFKCRAIEGAIDSWAKQFGVPREYSYFWTNNGQALTRLEATSHGSADLDPEDIEKTVHVLDRGANVGKPIMHFGRSLMSVLSDTLLKLQGP